MTDAVTHNKTLESFKYATYGSYTNYSSGHIPLSTVAVIYTILAAKPKSANVHLFLSTEVAGIYCDFVGSKNETYEIYSIHLNTYCWGS